MLYIYIYIYRERERCIRVIPIVGRPRSPTTPSCRRRSSRPPCPGDRGACIAWCCIVSHRVASEDVLLHFRGMQMMRVTSRDGTFWHLTTHHGESHDTTDVAWCARPCAMSCMILLVSASLADLHLPTGRQVGKHAGKRSLTNQLLQASGMKTETRILKSRMSHKFMKIDIKPCEDEAVRGYGKMKLIRLALRNWFGTLCSVMQNIACGYARTCGLVGGSADGWRGKARMDGCDERTDGQMMSRDLSILCQPGILSLFLT